MGNGAEEPTVIFRTASFPPGHGNRQWRTARKYENRTYVTMDDIDT
jgi:hypothetical protein